MEDLIEAYEEYIKLLGDELNELAVLATVHGWKSTRFEEGVRLRQKIASIIYANGWKPPKKYEEKAK